MTFSSLNWPTALPVALFSSTWLLLPQPRICDELVKVIIALPVVVTPLVAMSAMFILFKFSQNCVLMAALALLGVPLELLELYPANHNPVDFNSQV